jgi:hypothetical protein
MQVRTAVAASLIGRHLGKHDHVLHPLNEKIAQYDSKLAIQRSLIKTLITRKMQIPILVDEKLNVERRKDKSKNTIAEEALYLLDLHAKFPFGEKTENAMLNARGLKQVQKNCLGIMLATRALIHEDRNCHRSADRDRRRIEELGFDFSELAKELPHDEACLATLRKASLYLDTRGFVSGRRQWTGEQPRTLQVSTIESETATPGKPKTRKNAGPPIAPSNYQEALEDMDFAVLAAQFMELALNSSLYNSPDLSAQQIKQKKKMATRMTAVLLYHRMEIHLRAGKKQAAERDQASIERLGFQPGANLF